MAVDLNGLSEFDLARKRAASQTKKDIQARQDALKRRAATLGNLNSGSFLKQEQNIQRESQQNLTRANEGIDAAERSELRRKREIQQARDFAAAEAEKQRGFSRSLAEKQREFLSTEAERQRGFTSSEAETQRGFLSTEAERQRGFTSEENRMSRQQAADQFNQSYKLQVDQFTFNKKMSAEQLAIAKDAAKLATDQWDFYQKTELFNAIQSVLNQNEKLTTGQVDALVAVLGPEIMDQFQNKPGELLGAEMPASTVPLSPSGGTAPTRVKVKNLQDAYSRREQPPQAPDGYEYILNPGTREWVLQEKRIEIRPY